MPINNQRDKIELQNSISKGFQDALRKMGMTIKGPFTKNQQSSEMKDEVSLSIEEGYENIAKKEEIKTKKKEIREKTIKTKEKREKDQREKIFLARLKNTVTYPLKDLTGSFKDSIGELRGFLSSKITEGLGSDVMGLVEAGRAISSPVRRIGGSAIHGFKAEPKLQAGGEVIREGSAYLHAGEVVSPAPHVQFAEKMQTRQLQVLQSIEKSLMKPDIKQNIKVPDISKAEQVNVVAFPKRSMQLDEDRNTLLRNLAPDIAVIWKILNKIWGVQWMRERWLRYQQKKQDELQEEAHTDSIRTADNVYQLGLVAVDILDAVKGLREDQADFNADEKKSMFRDKIGKRSWAKTIIFALTGLITGVIGQWMATMNKIFGNIFVLFYTKSVEMVNKFVNKMGGLFETLKISMHKKWLQFVDWFTGLFSGKWQRRVFNAINWIERTVLKIGTFFKESIVGKFLGILNKIFGRGSAVFKMFSKFAPIFKIFKAIGKRLMWPLVIFEGIINIFKGFGLGDGSVQHKIIGTLSGVIKTVIDFFLRLPELIINGILKIFGKDPIDITPSLEQIFGFFTKTIPSWFDYFINKMKWLGDEISSFFKRNFSLPALKKMLYEMVKPLVSWMPESISGRILKPLMLSEKDEEYLRESSREKVAERDKARMEQKKSPSSEEVDKNKPNIKKSTSEEVDKPKIVPKKSAYMERLAQIESGGDPNAKSKTSSAMGLFQFTKGTWDDLVSKYGKTFGIGETDRSDPDAQKTFAELFTKDNKEYLEKRLGREVSASELYLAHFLGKHGAVKLLTADESKTGKELFGSKVADANKSVFYGKDGREKTVAELQEWSRKKMKGVDLPSNINALEDQKSKANAQMVEKTQKTQEKIAAETKNTNEKITALDSSLQEKTKYRSEGKIAQRDRITDGPFFPEPPDELEAFGVLMANRTWA